jgi:homoserine kinase type II
VRRPQTHHCAAVGQALAEMHLAVSISGCGRANALSRDGWRPLFKMSEARTDEIEPGMQIFISTELEFLEANWPGGPPRGHHPR